MSNRNPLSPAALTADEIREGIRFVWYQPYNESSKKLGTFRSCPYLDSEDHYVVDVEMDEQLGRIQTLGVSFMGIAPDRWTGTYSSSLTIEATIT